MELLNNTDKALYKEIYPTLECILENKGIQRPALKIGSLEIKGENLIGVFNKIDVKDKNHEENNIVLHLVAKTILSSSPIRMYLPLDIFFNREEYVLTKIMSEFKKIQNERNVHNVFESYAQCYGSVRGPVGDTIIMENMVEKGFTIHDARKPFDYNHITLVLQEYGRFHALSFALRDQKPCLFNKIVQKMQPFMRDVQNNNFDQFFKKPFEIVLEYLKIRENNQLYANLLSFSETIGDIAMDMCYADALSKYGAVRHGDCWINNFLFKYKSEDGFDIPKKLCILDFQASFICSPVLDVYHIIYATTDKQLRDKYGNELFAKYYKSFSGFLQELGSDPAQLYPYEVYLDHVKRYSIMGIYYGLLVLTNLFTNTKQLDKRILEVISDGCRLNFF